MNKVPVNIQFLAGLMMLAILLPVSGHAALETRVNTTLESDDWYPIPEEQMKSAVMDAALDALTGSGDISLQAGGDAADVSELNGHLSLVGAANRVSFTLELHTPGQPSRVATSSISIEGLDREAIYQSLGYIGGEVGNRLSDRLAIEAGSRTTPADGDGEAARLFNQGRELKREGEFDAARQKFVEVEAMAGDTEWSEMATDELEYGLLIFEARLLMNDLGDPATAMHEKRDFARLAANRLREAIAQNNNHATRVRESQNLLDQIEMALGSLDNAMRAQMVSEASPLRITLMEEYSMRGECMTSERLEEMLDNRLGRMDLTLESVRGTQDDRYYELADPNSEQRITLHCSNGEVDAEY